MRRGGGGPANPTGGGAILRIAPGWAGHLLSALPCRGDLCTTGPIVGSDGRLYFVQCTGTNSGVVGTDHDEFGWRERDCADYDISCEDIRLAGANSASPDPFAPGEAAVRGPPGDRHHSVPSARCWSLPNGN